MSEEASQANQGNPAPDIELEQWDETPTSLGLRAVFTIVAGGFLSWSQWHSNIFDPGAEWSRWVLLAVVANLLLPLGIIWFFFAQGLLRVDYLKNQAMNAWNYGWNFADWKTHLRWAGAMTLVMLPVLFFASRNPEARAPYAWYVANIHAGPTSALLFFALLVVYMFCWEWFHRGFLLFGIAQGAGAAVAIVVQAVMFGLAHAGKSQPEMLSAFAGGLLLGIISWRQKSFATAFYTHTLVHAAWMAMLLFYSS